MNISATSHRMRRLALSLLAVGMLTMVATTASAADKDDEKPKGPLAKELDNYWSVDRNLPVVEDKLFSRDGRFGVTLHGGLLSSEPFYGYLPVGGGLAYFFSNYAGIRADGEWYGSPGESPGPLTYETSITKFFHTELQDAFDPRTDLEDRFLWEANAVFVWNPLYGKWSFLNSELSHFDVDLVAGAGAISVERPLADRSDATTVTTPEIVLGGGISFFLTRHVTLRADGRFFGYEGAEAASQQGFFPRLEFPAEFQLGVTYLF